MNGTTRASITVVVLWVAACTAVVAWFATHRTRELRPTPIRTGDGPLDLDLYSDAWNRGGLIAGLLVATGVAVVALILLAVWARDTPAAE